METNGGHWLFDLDNTLYPASSGLFDIIDGRINRYLEKFCGIGAGEADFARQDYFERFGLTLLGVMEEHGADPAHYLEYVHRVPVDDLLRPNRPLQDVLRSIAAPKSIFTNGSRDHSLNVVRALGVEDLFGEIFDIELAGYIPKPDPRAYRTVLDVLGAEAERSVLVEDLPRNLPPAKELGMTTILVGPGAEAHGADYVIARVEDLTLVLSDLGQ